MPSRRNSPLIQIELLSPNKHVPRQSSIRRITPHCVAGNLSTRAILNLQAFKAGGGASTGYAIGSDGISGLGVEEYNRAWTTSSQVNDHSAITFEIANDGGAPDWHMSDLAINAFLDQAVETCRFYGFKKVNYQVKPDHIFGQTEVEKWIKTWAKPDEMIITLHNWYAKKACPGPYFMRQIPWLVREMNKRLQDSSWVPESFIGEGGIKVNQPNAASPFSPYSVKVKVTALNVRKGPGVNYAVVCSLVKDPNTYTIIEEQNGPGATKWGKLKSGIGWISLDHISRV